MPGEFTLQELVMGRKLHQYLRQDGRNGISVKLESSHIERSCLKCTHRSEEGYGIPVSAEHSSYNNGSGVHPQTKLLQTHF
eukprot:843192-Pelagomonas_calceolata.AAC.1